MAFYRIDGDTGEIFTVVKLTGKRRRVGKRPIEIEGVFSKILLKCRKYLLKTCSVHVTISRP
jgi:hypothetical protein